METRGPLKPGDRVGNYIVEQEIGRGAFAEVWKAVHHERGERVVAIKIAREGQYVRQLRREAGLPDLKHDNIVPILDCDTSSDRPYVVMPYYSAGSLADLIKQHPTGLPEERVERILRDILSGLSAAHERGIVHRDIKPSNILLDDKGRALLADFGQSRHQELWQTISLERERASIVGTIGYMAPEVAAGGEATPASDIYALGVVVFEMLTGRRPAGLEMPSERRAELNKLEFWDGLYWWASRPPADRYPNAGAMLLALRTGPKPIPVTAEAEEVSQPPIPAPAPLPTDCWEALRTRFREVSDLCGRLKAVRQEIDAALELYTERYRDVRVLRDKEARLAQALAERIGELGRVGAEIAGDLEQRVSPFTPRRQALLEQGYRAEHPDVRRLDEQTAPLNRWLEAARELSALGQAPEAQRVTRWPDLGESNLLLRCAGAWERAAAAHTIEAYEEFLKDFGTRLPSPWCDVARQRLARLERRERRKRVALRIVGAIVGAIAGATVGAIFGALTRNIEVVAALASFGATCGAIGGAIAGAGGGAIAGAIAGAILLGNVGWIMGGISGAIITGSSKH